MESHPVSTVHVHAVRHGAATTWTVIREGEKASQVVREGGTTRQSKDDVLALPQDLILSDNNH